MARNGSGTYSRVASTPYVYNTVIDQVVVNAEMDDIATALTNSLAKNGETTPTANLPMGGFKLTGLAAGSGNGESLRYEQVVGVYAALAGSASQAFSVSTLSAATTIGVGAATPAASGAGITFPATQSASSNANTLDDYERGDWTATLTGSTAAPTTPVTVTGKYWKIGDLCFVTAMFNNKDTTGATGDLRVTGLPFAAAESNPGTAMIIGFGAAPAYCEPFSTRLDFSNLVTGATIAMSAGAGKYLRISCFYRV